MVLPVSPTLIVVVMDMGYLDGGMKKPALGGLVMERGGLRAGQQRDQVSFVGGDRERLACAVRAACSSSLDMVA
jgi:hypothetical protein